MLDKCKLLDKPEPILLGDSINIKGYVEIRNGDTIIKGRNKFLGPFLAHISNIIVLGRLSAGAPSALFWRGPMHSLNMYLGTDTTTSTVYNTPSLYAPIGVSPGTAPNTIIGNTANPSNGVFQVSITATWNIGTVTGTVGEMALYLNLTPALQGYQWGGPATQEPGAIQIASRLSVKDSTLSSFVIDNTKPLAVTWTVQVSFS
jgi:hypothetical protein